MASDATWVREMRAEALTKLALTEREDLEIIALPPNAGYDFLVRIHGQAMALPPEFAVETKGTRRAITRRQIRQWIDRFRAPDALAATPSCLFAFDVDQRHGVYCWLNEPAIVAGEPRLRSASEPNDRDAPRIAPLDEQAVDHIVALVVAWTEAREQARLRHALAS